MKMKMKLILVALVTLTLQFSYAQKGWKNVGNVQGGKGVLSIDKAATLKTFTANLFKHSKIDGAFTNLELLPAEGGNYVLLFSGSSYKSTVFVKSEGGVLKAMTGTTCTTSDCSSEPRGCLVMYEGGEIGYCSPCANGGKCTKTTTSEELF